MLPNKNSFNNLGGELADYSPLTDPTTDLSAFASNEARADTAAMTRTIMRAWVSFTLDDGYDGYAEVSNTDFDAVYGNAIAFKPVVIKTSAGNYQVIFPESIVDARGTTQLVNLQVGWCNIETFTGLFVNAKKISSNIFDVYIFSAITNSLADPPISTKVTLFVL